MWAPGTRARADWPWYGEGLADSKLPSWVREDFDKPVVAEALFAFVDPRLNDGDGKERALAAQNKARIEECLEAFMAWVRRTPAEMLSPDRNFKHYRDDSDNMFRHNEQKWNGTSLGRLGLRLDAAHELDAKPEDESGRARGLDIVIEENHDMWSRCPDSGKASSEWRGPSGARLDTRR